MMTLVGQYGAKKWSVIASHLPGRMGKQCRERWHNHLDPNIRKGVAWTEGDDRIIIEFIQRFGECGKARPPQTRPCATAIAALHLRLRLRLRLRLLPHPLAL